VNIARLPCDEAAVLASVPDRPCAAGGGWVLLATILGSSTGFIDGTAANVALRTSVPPALAGTASGINNAVSRVAGLFATSGSGS